MVIRVPLPEGTLSPAARYVATLRSRLTGDSGWCEDVGRGRCAGEARGVFPAPHQMVYVEAL